MKKSIFHFILVKAISMKFGRLYACIQLVKMKQGVFKMLNIFQDIGLSNFDSEIVQAVPSQIPSG